MNSIQRLSEVELDRLEALLASDIFKGQALGLDALQGFFCAIVSGPETILPSRWLPEVFGAEAEFESQEQAEEVMSLLMRLYNEVAATLQAQEPPLLILYPTEEDAGELDFAPWCFGYLHGSQIGDTDWFEAAGEGDEDLSELLTAFLLLNGAMKEDAQERGEPWLPEEKEQELLAELREDLPSVVLDIYNFWLDRRVAPRPARRAVPKIGRNDPCPCGSGKKFKHCCGADPSVH
ncbi:MAG: UPF0149 family protein [Pseudomonadota bacterium]|jgi:uncharacterized protein